MKFKELLTVLDSEIINFLIKMIDISLYNITTGGFQSGSL